MPGQFSGNPHRCPWSLLGGQGVEQAWETPFQVLALKVSGTVLHVAGALKHRFYDRDPRNDVLRRML